MGGWEGICGVVCIENGVFRSDRGRKGSASGKGVLVPHLGRKVGEGPGRFGRWVKKALARTSEGAGVGLRILVARVRLVDDSGLVGRPISRPGIGGASARGPKSGVSRRRGSWELQR